MIDEVRAITGVLREFKASCRVLPPPLSYQTPRSTVYVLERGNGVREATVRRLEKEIESALASVRGESVAVRFLNSPFAISVPRRDPQNVSIRQMISKIRPIEGALLLGMGEHYNHAASTGGHGALPQLLQINLLAPTTPHVLLAGTTGAGKTVAIKNALLMGAIANSPVNVRYVLLDPKGIDFPIMEGLPHLAAPILTSPDQMRGALRALVSVMEERNQMYTQLIGSVGAYAAAKQSHKITDPQILICIDEVAELIDLIGDEAGKSIKRLLQIGRGLGIHLLLGTQKPEASFISGISLANIPVRGCGAVVTVEQGKYATGVPGSVLGAHKLTGRGDFILTINGSKMHPFQAGFIEEGEESGLVEAVRRRHGAMGKAWMLDYQEATIAPPAVPQRAFAPVHEELVRDLVQRSLETGTAPSGNQARKLYHEKYCKELNPATARILASRALELLN
ncbi:MAG TPA: FtsK/SpoIIIE domain-containing protein [Anaerolineae bacterium]|nr:FtsK/SpoIIIE domain-containing protein [Anaerolineae bacterium]